MSYAIEKNSFLQGNPGMRIQEDYYLKFCNQQAKGDGRKERIVFETDYQRFLWAFILGIDKGTRTPIDGKSRVSFKWDIIGKRADIANKIIGLTLISEYSSDISALKEDYLKTLEDADSSNMLSKKIFLAIEEYANTGFAIITQKNIDSPGYLDDGNAIIDDIIG